MPSPDLAELMLLYATRGVADWKDVASDIRAHARECLGNRIAETEWEAQQAVKTIFQGTNASKLKFIPMPAHPRGGDIERCFFVPIQEFESTGKQRVAFDLFLLVRDKNSLAFRLEAADPAGQAHDYTHVQMSRTLLRKTMPENSECIPEWIPDSYPAFPTSTTDPIGMFLYMATAVHGHSGGVLTVLLDIFRDRTTDVEVYFAELKKILY